MLLVSRRMMCRLCCAIGGSPSSAEKPHRYDDRDPMRAVDGRTELKEKMEIEGGNRRLQQMKCFQGNEAAENLDG